MHIFPTRAKIAIGEPTTISTREIQMAGRTLGELPRFPGASRVLYYGYLTPAKLIPLSVHRDRYDSIALRLDKVRLEHAEYRDIEEQGIANLVIREGTVLAKVHDLPVEADSSPKPEQKRVGLVELRLRPDDQVVIAEGLQVTLGQTIALRDVSKQRRTLELQLAEEIARLHVDLEQIDLQINATEQDIESREIERDELERRLRIVRKQALLSKEAHNIEGTVAEQRGRMEDLSAKRRLLLSRRSETTGRLESVLRQSSERRAIIERESEIKAGFEGRIVRLIREPGASELTLRISYEFPSG